MTKTNPGNPLALVYGPHPIFAKTARPVTLFDGDLDQLTRNMVATLYHEKAVGLGANMVGVLDRIIVLDLMENDRPRPEIFINPEILQKSDQTQCHTEASICFPGINADITRAHSLTLQYQDITGTPQTIMAEGYRATVIQHEVDYLNGIIFLDYLSPVKRKMLIKKTLKFQKMTRK